VAENHPARGRVGLVGCTIEIRTGNPDSPLYDFSLAVGSGLPQPPKRRAHSIFLLSLLPELTISLRRPEPGRYHQPFQAFEKRLETMCFSPGLPGLAAVARSLPAVSKPVNFMVGIKGKSFSVSALAAAGVRHISLRHHFIARQ